MVWAAGFAPASEPSEGPKVLNSSTPRKLGRGCGRLALIGVRPREFWHGRDGSNVRPAVLETEALPLSYAHVAAAG